MVYHALETEWKRNIERKTQPHNKWPKEWKLNSSRNFFCVFFLFRFLVRLRHTDCMNGFFLCAFVDSTENRTFCSRRILAVCAAVFLPLCFFSLILNNVRQLLCMLHKYTNLLETIILKFESWNALRLLTMWTYIEGRLLVRWRERKKTGGFKKENVKRRKLTIIRNECKHYDC